MAKISKKMMATVLTASMVAALGSTSAFAEEAASDEDFSGVELNFWTAPYGDDEEAFLKEHLAAWEERTGATVNIEITPWDSYEEKMMTGIAGSDGPDIAYMYNEMIYNYMANGQLEPLDDYFTDEEKDNYIYWSNGTVQGTQYMLPYLVGAPRILFANMDLLNEAGWDHVPTTWDELKQQRMFRRRPESLDLTSTGRDISVILMRSTSRICGRQAETSWMQTAISLWIPMQL